MELEKVPWMLPLDGVFVCDHLINLYKQHTSEAFIYAPISGVFTNNKIAGFVHDSALTATKQTYNPYLKVKMERNGQIWERNLFTLGGKLEIPECEFAIFQWLTE
jgi:hypothetical protein